MKGIVLCLTILFFASCGASGPEPVVLNSDNCHLCKMTISQGGYASEIITGNGKIFKFDDLKCMIDFKNTAGDEAKSYSFFVTNFNKHSQFLEAQNAYYIEGGKIQSPMQGNVLAFSNQAEAEALALKLNATHTSWNKIASQ